jgi:hypothetical protein
MLKSGLRTTPSPWRSRVAFRQRRCDMVQNTHRGFMKQAAVGAAALLAYSPSRVLGANDRVRLSPDRNR